MAHDLNDLNRTGQLPDLLADTAEPSSTAAIQEERLHGLRACSSNEDVERELKSLASVAAALDPIALECLGEEVLAVLDKHAFVRRPSRMVDVMLKAARASSGRTRVTGREIEVERAVPCPESVDPERLWHDLRQAIEDRMALRDSEAVACALWTLMTYTVPAWGLVPYLAITSATMRCGKTRLLNLLAALADGPIHSGSVSPAAIYWLLGECAESPPTLFIDEADTFIAGRDQLVGILNSGIARDGFVIRVVEGPDGLGPRQFSTFCPKALAAIGRLPPTVADRSIEIRLKRKSSTIQLLPVRLGELRVEFADLRSRMARFGQDEVQNLSTTTIDAPGALDDRARDRWRPLVAIAAALGPEALEEACAAAIELEARDDDRDGRHARLLVASARVARSGDDAFVRTADLIEQLNEDDTVVDLCPVSAEVLASSLRHFGIRPRRKRSAGPQHRGYLTDALLREAAPYE